MEYRDARKGEGKVAWTPPPRGPGGEGFTEPSIHLFFNSYVENQGKSSLQGCVKNRKFLTKMPQTGGILGKIYLATPIERPIKSSLGSIGHNIPGSDDDDADGALARSSCASEFLFRRQWAKIRNVLILNPLRCRFGARGARNHGITVRSAWKVYSGFVATLIGVP